MDATERVHAYVHARAHTPPHPQMGACAHMPNALIDMIFLFEVRIMCFLIFLFQKHFKLKNRNHNTIKLSYTHHFRFTKLLKLPGIFALYFLSIYTYIIIF